MASAVLAVDGEPPEHRAPGQRRAGAEREGLDDVGAAPDAAVDEHLDAAVDRLDHLGQDVDRRRDPVELAPAVVGDDDPRGAVLAREHGVLAGQHALDEQRHAGFAGDSLEVVPRERRRDHLEHLLRRHASAPERRDVDVRWDRERRAEVALAVPAHRCVDRQQKRAIAAVACLGDQLARHALVSKHVELEPARPAHGRHVGRRGRRERREAHDCARGARRACSRDLAVGMREALEGDRRDEQWHRDVLPEHRGRSGARLDVDQHARAQYPPAVRLDVVAKRQLVAGTARVVPVRTRLEPLRGEPLVVPDIERLHRRSVTALSLLPVSPFIREGRHVEPAVDVPPSRTERTPSGRSSR